MRAWSECCECTSQIQKNVTWLIISVTLFAQYEVYAANAWLYARNTKYIVRTHALNVWDMTHVSMQHCHNVTLQHTATHCNTLQHTTLMWHDSRVNAALPQYYTATHCNTLQYTTLMWHDSRVNAALPQILHCNTLQHTTLMCDMTHLSMQHCHKYYTATHCNTLQHTTLMCDMTHVYVLTCKWDMTHREWLSAHITKYMCTMQFNMQFDYIHFEVNMYHTVYHPV